VVVRSIEIKSNEAKERVDQRLRYTGGRKMDGNHREPPGWGFCMWDKGCFCYVGQESIGLETRNNKRESDEFPFTDTTPTSITCL
jgi:hypothetical protein